MSSFTHFNIESRDGGAQSNADADENQQIAQNARIRFKTEVMEAVEGIIAEFDNLTEQINLYVNIFLFSFFFLKKKRHQSI